jgi:hypothetical protein
MAAFLQLPILIMNNNMNDSLQFQVPKSTVTPRKTLSTCNAMRNHKTTITDSMGSWNCLSHLQSSFLHQLPREIRDLVYEWAFGNEQRDFHLNDLLVIASPTSPVDGSSIRGLNIWLLTCKSVCVEAIATFSRTRFSTPRLRGQSKSSLRNPLVFHEKSVRNIALCYPYSDPETRSSCYFKDCRVLHTVPPKLFLKAFTPYFTQHLDLKLLWDVDTIVATEPQRFLVWQKMWYGRFRRVEVCLVGQPQQRFERSYGQPPRPLPSVEMKLLDESAEVIARRLVRGDTDVPVSMHWIEEGMLKA